MIRTAIKFGAFVVLCLVMTTYLAFTIGNININDPLGHDYYTVSATFDDVTGLIPDDNVKIAGVVVGKVTAIKVDKGRAKVTFRVKDSVRVPSNTTAQVRWRNLIGQRFVYLNVPATGQSPTMMATDGSAEIKDTTSVVDLGELFNRLGPIIQGIDPHQVNDFLDTISQALDGNTDKVGQAIDDLAVLARSLSQRDQTIGRLLDNLNVVAGTITNRDQQIRVMLDNLVLISQTFSANTQTLDTALVEFGRFSGNLSNVLDSNSAELDRIISNLDLVTQDVVKPRIATLDSALKGLDTAARKVFASADLGEWLNQSILCAAVGPPASGVPTGNCTGLGPVLGGTTSGGVNPTPNAAAGTSAPPTTAGPVGSAAPSIEAGAQNLVDLLTSGLNR